MSHAPEEGIIKEYLMYYRGPGLLSINCTIRLLLPTPLPSARPAAHRRAEKERQLADGRGRRGREGAKLYDGEEAWSSMYGSSG